MNYAVFLLLGLASIAISCSTFGSSSHQARSTTQYSPRINGPFLTNVYWGDTHLHTSYSIDANLFGMADLTPADAYRFAQGEAIELKNGMRARINRPLDFLAVTDHAEYLGIMRLIREEDASVMGRPVARLWRRLLDGDQETKFRLMVEISSSFESGETLFPLGENASSSWHQIIQMAEYANSPGNFTAFAGFEWTSLPNLNTMHRVVIFADGLERTSRTVPFSPLDSQDPEKLWEYLARYKSKTDGDAMAIPHNSNLSNGHMFPKFDADGVESQCEYLMLRNESEPLIEVTQIKGDSETHPLLSPNDKFADYGTWDRLGLAKRKTDVDVLEHEYARSALGIGIETSSNYGINPYMFGFVGGSDSHVAMSAVEESNFYGKFAFDMPSSDRPRSKMMGLSEATAKTSELQSAGYTAVWATENTRSAIFNAMRRREVYATTGPRMTLRLFGGWDFESEDIASSNFVTIGYEGGVPMGGVLTTKPQEARAPSFMVSVVKDPLGANLDRVQIVKGWLNAGGEIQEEVYDVVWSGSRVLDDHGDLPPVGNTVDIERGIYFNDIGDVQLASVWSDPEFNPKEPAFYYARVLEIPTPRWLVYDKVRLQAETSEGMQLTHQERAYSSPIWYAPEMPESLCERQRRLGPILSVTAPG